MDMPLAARLFERLVAEHRALAARSADSEFHRQHRDAHDNEADEVKQHEIAAAVLTCYVGKAPDITYADSAARADQQEAQPGAEGFSLHIKYPLL